MMTRWQLMFETFLLQLFWKGVDIPAGSCRLNSLIPSLTTCPETGRDRGRYSKPGRGVKGGARVVLWSMKPEELHFLLRQHPDLLLNQLLMRDLRWRSRLTFRRNNLIMQLFYTFPSYWTEWLKFWFHCAELWRSQRQRGQRESQTSSSGITHWLTWTQRAHVQPSDLNDKVFWPSPAAVQAAEVKVKLHSERRGTDDSCRPPTDTQQHI